MRDMVRKKAEMSFQKNTLSLNLPKGISFFNAKKGTYVLDIIPYVVSDKHHPQDIPVGMIWYERTIWVHKKIGALEKTYICPKTIGKPCPICEHRATLMKDPDHDKEEVRVLKPQLRGLYNIIDKTEDPKNNKIQVWDMAYYNFGKVLDEELKEEDRKYSAFADLQGGYSLRIRLSEEELGKSKFLSCSKIDFKERKRDYPESILDEVADLDKVFTVLSYKELEKIFTETVVEDEDNEDDNELDIPFDSEEEEDEEVETRRSRSRSKKKVSKRTDEDDEDDEDPEEEDEDDEDNEEEDDIEDEDDEDDEDNEEEDDIEDEDPEEEDEDDEKPSKRNGKVKRNSCPAGGMFGRDFDKYEDCEDCDLFDSCNKLYKTKYKKSKAGR
jgi:hypothetical protein